MKPITEEDLRTKHIAEIYDMMERRYETCALLSARMRWWSLLPFASLQATSRELGEARGSEGRYAAEMERWLFARLAQSSVF
jgi:hypothetical protein